jgi:hypothetical protein
METCFSPLIDPELKADAIRANRVIKCRRQGGVVAEGANPAGKPDRMVRREAQADFKAAGEVPKEVHKDRKVGLAVNGPVQVARRRAKTAHPAAQMERAIHSRVQVVNPVRTVAPIAAQPRPMHRQPLNATAPKCIRRKAIHRAEFNRHS